MYFGKNGFPFIIAVKGRESAADPGGFSAMRLNNDSC